MSCYAAVFTSEDRDTQAQAQGSQPFHLPSCLTLRGAGINNSIKKWFSARASALTGLKVSDQLVAYATRFFILRLKNFM